MGKPKGIMQVLREHIFMDTSKDVCTYYTLRGREGNYVNNIIETIFGELIQNCLNFIEEETLLQNNVYKMGYRIDHIIVDCTPKHHFDISSEGIEYSWGSENNYFRRLSLDKIKG